MFQPVTDFGEGLAEPGEAAGVGGVEGVVEDVAVAIEILGVFGDLDDGVGTEEAAEFGIVDPAVHVDEPAVVELFVAGVATFVITGGGAVCIGLADAVGFPCVRLAALAPGVEGLVFSGGVGKAAAIPSAGEQQIGGAEVILDHGGELDRGSRAIDGTGVNRATEPVSMHGFGVDLYGRGTGAGAVDFALIAAEIEGFPLGAAA